MHKEIDWGQYQMKKYDLDFLPEEARFVGRERLGHILFLIALFESIKIHEIITNISDILLKIIQDEVESEIKSGFYLNEDSALKLIDAVVRAWGSTSKKLNWLKSLSHSNDSCIPYCAILVFSKHWTNTPEILGWLKEIAVNVNSNPVSRIISITEIGNKYKGTSINQFSLANGVSFETVKVTQRESETFHRKKLPILTKK
ncbi:hypothetical protein XM38_022100 [Halomicronema hongdechloris C2206]|uniref:Uncharacterized protein n=1 Tax=Halomicronema hongdechloris C2206 TaxID=1641165 RepID=A0A1Z3HLU0_9CYAN|nr:hypothetical protein [Halomicronema hongdechloris]ASC71258.1 hypothetical protein XM38_022100 [Halomicronema hongdechloris C2206]